jgi:hypothetical protein
MPSIPVAFFTFIYYFENIFNPFLAAFRSGFGCQSTLLRVIEDWKHALDKNENLAAILMDLSKAFDCLPHDLLLLILNANGLSKSSLDLLCSSKAEITFSKVLSDFDKVLSSA